MIQQITTGGMTNVAAASSPPVTVPPEATDGDATGNAEQVTAPILPFNEALTQLMKNRYAAVKTAVAATNDNQAPESMDVDK
jgi:hypothetical protein